jgi:trehalose/maltose hydrolase-like predicted phosphorylase
MRASIAARGGGSQPSTFVAGIYVADESLGPRLAVFPDWLQVEITIEDQQLSLAAGRVLARLRRLDLRQGVLWPEGAIRTPADASPN